MKRTNSIQIITPKMLEPATRVPFTRSAGRPSDSTTRKMRATSTGPPTTNAMKIVRRDHSISPNDKSNTRRDALTSDGGTMGADVDDVIGAPDT